VATLVFRAAKSPRKQKLIGKAERRTSKFATQVSLFRHRTVAAAKGGGWKAGSTNASIAKHLPKGTLKLWSHSASRLAHDSKTRIAAWKMSGVLSPCLGADLKVFRRTDRVLTPR
jgi:hypothetical protein